MTGGKGLVMKMLVEREREREREREGFFLRAKNKGIHWKMKR